MNNFDAALREAAAILLQVSEMEEHNETIFRGKWKKGSKAWSGEAIARLRKVGIDKMREAIRAYENSINGEATLPGPCAPSGRPNVPR